MSKYGWTPDLPDHRDRIFAATVPHWRLPSSADLRLHMPEVYDQGQLGSCTANAIAAAIQYQRMRQGLADFAPSRLFIYYNERVMEGTVQSDAGAMIRDGIKSVAQQGDCPETEWGYDISKFALAPTPQCYLDALKYKALDYWRVPRDMVQIKGAIAAGFAMVFGFTVYENFETDAVAADGRVPMPKDGDNVAGGHAVLAVGFDDAFVNVGGVASGAVICRNSWSAGWGDKGYFYLPYPFFMDPNLSDDFWVIKAEAA